jgi:hypothetical protein
MVKSNHPADDAENISGHESDFGAYPPSDPAKDRYTDYHEEFFHFTS